jgi:hypothetical protein
VARYTQSLSPAANAAATAALLRLKAPQAVDAEAAAQVRAATAAACALRCVCGAAPDLDACARGLPR